MSVRGETVTEGRPAMLTRALSNLVENAAKFDPGGTGPIEVAVAGPALEGPIRVEVRDRGPGIAEADLTRVFDRFFRTAGARSRPGSGLGLSIVREVALAHGERRSPSGGTEAGRWSDSRWAGGPRGAGSGTVTEDPGVPRDGRYWWWGLGAFLVTLVSVELVVLVVSSVLADLSVLAV